MDNGCSDWLGDSPLSWAGEHFSRLIPQPRHKDKLRSYLVGGYPATHGHYWPLGSFNGGAPAALLPTRQTTTAAFRPVLFPVRLRSSPLGLGSHLSSCSSRVLACGAQIAPPSSVLRRLISIAATAHLSLVTCLSIPHLHTACNGWQRCHLGRTSPLD